MYREDVNNLSDARLKIKFQFNQKYAYFARYSSIKSTFMRNKITRFVLFVTISVVSMTGFAQVSTLTGSVKNAVTGESLSAVSITVKGSGDGTFTDNKGEFKLAVNKTLPVTLLFSSVGYAMQEINLTSFAPLNINLQPSNVLGQEIVIAATRTPSRILESPVTIERISSANIRNSATPGYYDMIGKLKGVDIVNASLLFTSPSTRGFNGSGNLRVNQIVDGMDNQAPGLNFSVGSIVGLTQLDVESVELLPGASSALYGPGGMNGAIVINSKDPFKYQGFSADIKTGVMHIDRFERPGGPYFDWSGRWAKKVSEKFAFKVSAQLIQAKDWIGVDNRNYNRLGYTGKLVDGTRTTDPNYDGVNIYGDETTVDLKSAVLRPLANLFPPYQQFINALPASIPVSRTGYEEKNVVDPNAVNAKVFGAAHYKLNDKTTLIAEGFFGTGNTVYTGSDRYSLRNLKIAQYKLELNNTNWFLRGFTTQEDAGDSYNATVTTRLLNEAWKPSGGSTGWYAQYGQAFLSAKLAGQSDINAHNIARSAADQGRPLPGSPLFKQLLDQVRSIPISKGGGLFVDRTNLYNIEGQYNFSQFTKSFADIIIGANYKRYVLNSEGTLFADSTGKIGINEVGAYVQATKRFLDDKLKFIVSGRYDKNQNFDGRFTPRFSVVIRVAPENNLRMSYQTAYRFPSTQQQFINLRVGGGTRLLGGLETFQDYYNFKSNQVYVLDSNILRGSLVPRDFKKFAAESVKSFDGGYKGLLMNNKLLVDLYGYYGVYKNFIARVTVAQSVNGNPNVFTDLNTVKANISDPTKVTSYSVPTNVDGDVQTYGYGISLDYSLPSNFLIGVTASQDKLSKVPDGFVAQFNAPEYRAGASFSNTGFGHQNRLGFNVTYRYQGATDYQGDFVNGPVPAFHTLDGQVSYKFPAQRILLKLGGTNILNQYYINGFGNAAIGGLYYVSFGYNLF